MGERVNILVVDGLDWLEIRLFGVVLLGVVVLGVDRVGGRLAVQGHADGVRTDSTDGVAVHGVVCTGGIGGETDGQTVERSEKRKEC